MRAVNVKQVDLSHIKIRLCGSTSCLVDARQIGRIVSNGTGCDERCADHGPLDTCRVVLDIG